VDEINPAPVVRPGELGRAVLRNTLVQLAGKAITAVMGIAVIGILTRYLGAAEYGLYTLTFAYLSFFQAFSDLGLSLVGVRQIAKDEASAGGVLKAIFFIRLALGIVAVAAAVGLSFVLYGGEGRAQLRTGIAIVAVGVFINMIGSVPTSYFQAKLQMIYSSVADLAGRAVTFVLILAVVWYGYSLNALFWAAVVGFAVSAAINYAYIRERLTRLPKLDWALSKQLLVDAAPLGLMLVMNSIYFRVDTVIISLFRSNLEVGWYGFAYRALETLAVVFSFFTVSVFPVVSRYLGDPDSFKRVAQKSFDFIVFMSLPSVAAIFLLARRLVLILGGGQFEPAIGALQILAFATGLMAINSFLGYLIIAANRQRDALWLNGLALAGNVVLNLALVPRFGFVAAAYVTVVSEVAITVAALYLVRRFVGFVPSLALAPSVLIAVAVTAAVIWILDRLVAGGLGGTLFIAAAGVLVFAVSAVALRIVDVRNLAEFPNVARIIK
jgi:O-antigen/teichoic acid export membrane protein